MHVMNLCNVDQLTLSFDIRHNIRIRNCASVSRYKVSWSLISSVYYIELLAYQKPPFDIQNSILPIPFERLCDCVDDP